MTTSVAAAVASDPLAAVWAGTAAWHRRRFALRNCRVARRGRVHAVAMAAWVGGHEVPAPACRVGVGGWDLGVLEPSTQPVSCGRCLRLRRDRAGGEASAGPPAQLRLL